MATNQLDLWPTITATVNTQNTPTSILRRQADLLEKKTDGLVQAYVKPRQWEIGEAISAATHLGLTRENASNHFAYSFYLVAPALENYRYLLFWMLHSIEMYPLIIKDSPAGDVRVESEDEFIGALRAIFAHEKTQRIIQAMIAQSRA
jgi:hypothetical protein